MLERLNTKRGTFCVWRKWGVHGGVEGLEGMGTRWKGVDWNGVRQGWGSVCGFPSIGNE